MNTNIEEALTNDPERLESLAWKSYENSCAAAQNPMAPAKLLTNLAGGSKRIAHLLLRNPAVPSDTFLFLMNHWQLDSPLALENPAFDLLVLASPFFANSISDSSLKHMIKSQSFPVTLIELIARKELHEVNWVGSDSLHAQALRDPRLSPDTISWATKSKDKELRAAVASNPSLPVAALQKLISDRAAEVRAGAAQSPNIDPVQLARLSKDKQKIVRAAVSSNPKTLPETLESLSDDTEGEVRGAVARSPATPSYLLQRLAKDWRPGVRQAIIRNPSTPLLFLEKLAKDAVKEVRYELAQSARPCAEILLQDSDEYVRTNLAQNTATPPEILARLLDGELLTARYASQNPSLPVACMESALAHPNEEVRLGLARNSSLPLTLLERVLSSPELLVQSAAAENPNAPEALLEEMAQGRAEVQCMIAKRNDVSWRLLDSLSQDPHHHVRRTVAWNRWAHQTIIDRLREDSSKEVRDAADKTNEWRGYLG